MCSRPVLLSIKVMKEKLLSAHFVYRTHLPFSTVPISICCELDNIKRLFCTRV